jgi:hypothetical protein
MIHVPEDRLTAILPGFITTKILFFRITGNFKFVRIHQYSGSKDCEDERSFTGYNFRGQEVNLLGF